MSRLPLRDYHLHTHLSWCGQESNTPSNIILKLSRLGYDSIGLSDHLHPGTDPEIFTATRQAVQKIGSPLPVLVGCEADVTAIDRTTLPPNATGLFDYIILSPNHHHLDWVAFPEEAKKDPKAAADYTLKTHLTAVSHPAANILGHPFAFSWSREENVEPVLEHITTDKIAELIRVARENEVALEVSPATIRSESLRGFMSQVCLLACENGVRLSLGSDAHWIEDVGNVTMVLDFLAELKVDPENILDLRGIRRPGS